jgi:single-stranded DNA-specific DHH superfamily exonuclease
LESASDLLEKFGGHPAAAGFTVPTEAIDSLRTRLCTWVTEQIGAEALVPESIYDAELGVDELHEQLLNQILRLDLSVWAIPHRDSRYARPTFEAYGSWARIDDTSSGPLEATGSMRSGGAGQSISTRSKTGRSTSSAHSP